MKTITKYLNKILCITLSTTLLTSQIIFATTGLPEQIESAAYIPLSDNFLPSDERHAFAPPIEGVSAELANADTELSVAYEAAANQDWNLLYNYSSTFTNQNVGDIFYNAFMYVYSEQFLEYMEQYFPPNDPMIEAWKQACFPILITR